MPLTTQCMYIRLITWCVAQGSWNNMLCRNMHSYAILLDANMNYIYFVEIHVAEQQRFCISVARYVSCSFSYHKYTTSQYHSDVCSHLLFVKQFNNNSVTRNQTCWLHLAMCVHNVIMFMSTCVCCLCTTVVHTLPSLEVDRVIIWNSTWNIIGNSNLLLVSWV